MAGRKKTRIPLQVFLNGRLVGHLRRESNGAIDFQYAADWLSWQYAFPISLSLPLREDRYIGDPVIAVFDNLLPDNDQIRKHLAARTRADGVDAFSLLSTVGRDCVGALQFLPESEPSAPSQVITGRELTNDEISSLLTNLTQAPLGVTSETEFRISLAGAQEKTALLWWNEKWHIPHGTTPTTHIFKPAIGKLSNGIDLSDSVENEYLCLELARALGLPCAHATIKTFGPQNVLVVERFDRRWTRDGRLLRLAQEDCCQALSVPPTRKYESDGGPGIAQLVELLKASDDPETDQRLFLKSQIFFWLIGATDGHAKNFSLTLLPGGRFRLTPLYDIMSAQPYVTAGQIRHKQYKLAMALGHNRHYVVDQILPRHFEQTAAIAGVGKNLVTTALAEIADTLPGALDDVAGRLPAGFPDKLIEDIRHGIEQRIKTIPRRTEST